MELALDTNVEAIHAPSDHAAHLEPMAGEAGWNGEVVLQQRFDSRQPTLIMPNAKGPRTSSAGDFSEGMQNWTPNPMNEPYGS